MSGYHALKGFEYQAVVSLDILLEWFYRTPAAVEIRPEGEDDLVVRPAGNAMAVQHFYQIKKPRESNDGNLKRQAWKLSEAIDELLPNAVTLLRGNHHQQTWVLGDEVAGPLRELFVATSTTYTTSYLLVLHRLVRKQVDMTATEWGGAATGNLKTKKALENWQPPTTAGASLPVAVADLQQRFLQHAASLQVAVAAQQAYAQGLLALHADLPDVLSRVSLRPTYGTDQQLRHKIEQELQLRYNLPGEVVRHTLLGNLRSFIQDIATQLGRWISREEFELELRTVWPRLTHIAEPPALPVPYVRRAALLPQLVQQAATRGALEITGVAGAGKTALARELLEYGRAVGRYALYAEVRPNHLLRDVLSGVAFHLRRWGFTEPFQRVADLYAADEQAISAMAQALRPSGVLLLIDLVEGDCSEDFARELAQFVKLSSRGSTSLVVLGQVGGLRALTAIERTVLGIPATQDISGLEFEQFSELVRLHHGEAWDRHSLYTIFEHFTGGRSTGLLARLADALAQCATLADLQQITQLSPDQALVTADRRRYEAIVGAAVRTAADQLVCFALPFRVTEAEAIFPELPVRAAVLALAQQGLLRQHNPEQWEMHETIRAGLESLLAPALRQQTHRRLAAAYAAQPDLIAQLLHLERGGQAALAQKLAKAAFEAGEDYALLAPLSSYLRTRRAVSADEAVAWLANAQEASDKLFLLTRLIEHLGTPATATGLLQHINAQADRFDAAGEWGRYMAEAALSCDAGCLYELVQFCLDKGANKDYPRLDLLARALIRRKPVVTPALLTLYAQGSDPLRARLTGVLLRDIRRAALAPALLFASRYTPPTRDSRQLFPYYDTPLRLCTTPEVVEFLAALPPVDANRLVASGSMQFGRLEEWVWLERQALRAGCTELLQAGTAEETVLFNALRVLLFLGDEQVSQLAAPLANAASGLGKLALMIPTLLPGRTDPTSYWQCLLDVQADIQQRILAFHVLLAIVEDADDLYAQLVQANPGHAAYWEFLLVMSIASRPCLSALPVLEAHLQRCTSASQARLHATSILKLADLSSAAVTDFLLRCLASPWHFVCHGALLALQRRRAPQALPALLAFCQRTDDDSLRYSALLAAIASHPTDAATFTPIWSHLPTAARWRCVLAGRLGAETEASYLQATATDIAAPWQLRRAAVLAAGHLPRAHVLLDVAPQVLAEPDAFALDTHPHFLGHDLLAHLLQALVPGLRALFVTSPQRFQLLVSQAFDQEVQPDTQRSAAPTGSAIAQWLFDRLTFYDWAHEALALDHVLNEVHLPLVQAAVCKGLRRTKQFALLEQLIPTLSSRWLVATAVTEWAKPGRDIPAADWQRLATLLAGLPAAPGLSPPEVLAHCQGLHKQRSPLQPFYSPPPASLSLTHTDVMAALKTGKLAAAPALVLVGLTAAQIQELAYQLAPQQDFPVRWVATEPQLAFTAAGFTVQATRPESQPRPVELHGRLRPALAAANAAGVDIAWHPLLLQEPTTDSPRPGSYVALLLASLGAQQRADRLYEELAVHAAAMMLACTDIMWWQPIVPLLDDRLVPTLLHFAETGPDALLRLLCWLASHVPQPSIDTVLQRLFRRWIGRFDPRDNSQLQHNENHALWQAFGYLREHPRFAHLPAYDLRLDEVLMLPLAAYHKQEVLKAVAHCPSTYLQQEKMLLQASSFAIYPCDEVDRYDGNAIRLFRTLPSSG